MTTVQKNRPVRTPGRKARLLVRTACAIALGIGLAACAAFGNREPTIEPPRRAIPAQPERGERGLAPVFTTPGEREGPPVEKNSFACKRQGDVIKVGDLTITLTEVGKSVVGFEYDYNPAGPANRRTSFRAHSIFWAGCEDLFKPLPSEPRFHVGFTNGVADGSVDVSVNVVPPRGESASTSRASTTPRKRPGAVAGGRPALERRSFEDKRQGDVIEVGHLRIKLREVLRRVVGFEYSYHPPGSEIRRGSFFEAQVIGTDNDKDLFPPLLGEPRIRVGFTNGNAEGTVDVTVDMTPSRRKPSPVLPVRPEAPSQGTGSTQSAEEIPAELCDAFAPRPMFGNKRPGDVITTSKVVIRILEVNRGRIRISYTDLTREPNEEKQRDLGIPRTRACQHIDLSDGTKAHIDIFPKLGGVGTVTFKLALELPKSECE